MIMLEDRTGWEVVFDGTDRGRWGRTLLPPRPSKPSELWTTASLRRHYTRTGRYARAAELTAEEVSVNLIDDPLQED